LVNIVGHGDIGQFGRETLFGVGAADEGHVHDGVGALEVVAVGVAIVIGEIGDVDVGYFIALAVGVAHVEQGEVVLCAQRRQYEPGDRAGGAGEHYFFAIGHRGVFLVFFSEFGMRPDQIQQVFSDVRGRLPNMEQIVRRR
jgi:hypothetical protein